MFEQKIQIRHRLLTRLLISHILIVSLPLFFTGKVLVDTARQSIEQTILERNLEFAVRTTRFIELKLQSAREILASQAKHFSFKQANTASLELEINTIVNDFAIFNSLSVLDTTGHLIASTSFEREASLLFNGNGRVATALDYVSHGQTFLRDAYISEERLPLLDIGEPLRYQGEISGILYAVVDLKAMWDLVDQNVVGEQGEAFIFNKEGI
ncbi:MAG: cache domain-containing protein, partial [bacterium]